MRTIWHTLWFRLTAAFLIIAIVGVAVVGLLANQATAAGFRAFLTESEWADLRADLANLYERQGNWEGAELLLSAGRPGQGGAGLLLLDETGAVVAVAGGRANRPTGHNDADEALSVLVNGRTVATLLVKFPATSGAGGAGSHAAQTFLAQVNRALWIGGTLSVLLALALGVLLARWLTQPLSHLTQATHQMAGGNLRQQVPPAQGELGELAASFNQMAGALALAEQQRQQLLADVAHELRTPLSIMRGHIEAMLDGVFAFTPDNLAVVHEETLLLGRLVDDLRTLSLVESGQLPLNLHPVDLVRVVRQTAVAFEPLAEAEGVQLLLDVPAAVPLVLADSDRIQQVMGNLVANALRHLRQGTCQPCMLRLELSEQPGMVQVCVADNGPGLSPEARQHVFDRFWRAESSRTRDQGGSGLGLTICRGIVLAHHGRIWVDETPGGGATFIFALPVHALNTSSS
ncbi:MAG TPA: ATP-binding protein [Chloroflexota bacterium]|nr:ATP-binding protein [Chloroflexota bacterium]